MPGIQEDKRCDKPHNVCRSQRDNDSEELLIGKQLREGKIVVRDFPLDGLDRHKHSRESQVNHDTNPEVHHRHVEFVGPTRPVTQSQDEAGHQSREIKPFENNTQDLTSRAEQVLVAKRCCENMENQEEITLRFDD